VGRVAALNATNDLWAKGVEPRFALALVSLPDGASGRGEETLYQVLAGARAALDGERVTLLGGHTVASGPAGGNGAPRADGSALAVGFAVWGATKDRDALLTRAGLAPGDRLVLTRALGTGVLWRADMLGEAPSAWIEAAVASMTRSNAAASAAAVRAGARACTDVSGFGLAGHLAALLEASGVSARLELASLPLLPGVRACLARGLRSSVHAQNAELAAALRIEPAAAADPALDVLFDPQTSGGLLFGVAPERTDAALAALQEAGDHAAVIGVVTEAQPGGPRFTVALDWR
jgi:selenide,water dikinase